MCHIQSLDALIQDLWPHPFEMNARYTLIRSVVCSNAHVSQYQHQLRSAMEFAPLGLELKMTNLVPTFLHSVNSKSTSYGPATAQLLHAHRSSEFIILKSQ